MRIFNMPYNLINRFKITKRTWNCLRSLNLKNNSPLTTAGKRRKVEGAVLVLGSLRKRIENTWNIRHHVLQNRLWKFNFYQVRSKCEWMAKCFMNIIILVNMIFIHVCTKHALTSQNYQWNFMVGQIVRCTWKHC